MLPKKVSKLLDKTYEQCPMYDVKIVLGDFNAKIGKEDIFGSTIGRHSLRDTTTSGNELSLIDFAAGCNVTIASTRCPHVNIHKRTWHTPDQQTTYQIDHVAIDVRHSSSILDVQTFRAANIDSDHYLVAAKVRLRISQTPQQRGNTMRRSQQATRTFADRVALNFSRDLCSQHQVLKTSGLNAKGHQKCRN